ncbi:Aspartate/ornithine carbamoyltransferase [Pseudomassariella vexata]|uniref:Ornithine carbamoyltransferase, mitochondrial n=1 Tax=Pseudomassariella vexata TaxID=1141098 RepID=A0A1Y2DXH2_9PEZI|nr:Aspartate/ornithine carbamoyltransferase [Pseudomassariella vexata]ORY64000.1 Aspartate/ornithine carbamoyltransferase [Pseudomassariella vexata]
MWSASFRLAKGAFGGVQTRGYALMQSSAPLGKATYKPRHLMSISDLTRDEFSQLIRNASRRKQQVKDGRLAPDFRGQLSNQTVAMMFSKRSTRTRVSTESAVAMMGGHPMFLGKDDIQLGVNESLHDTSKIISSMTSCMVARVGPHSDVTELAKYSSVPVINALSDDFHPLQTIADFLTIHETVTFPDRHRDAVIPPGLKIAWIGDANNVLFDLAIACVKMGVTISVATPPGYEIPKAMEALIEAQAKGVESPGKLEQTTVPEQAVKDADILVTDTWISMGQEAETKKRLKDFEGFQITKELARRGGAKPDWLFMHCLPRHPEEVDDEVFYGTRSVVFQEGENRLWAAIAALEAFVVNKGNIV